MTDTDTETLLDSRCPLCGWAGETDDVHRCPECDYGLVTFEVAYRE